MATLVQEHLETLSGLEQEFATLDECVRELNYAEASLRISDGYVAVGNEDAATNLLNSVCVDLGIGEGNEFLIQAAKNIVEFIKKIILKIVDVLKKIFKYIKSWFVQTKGMLQTIEVTITDSIYLLNKMEKEGYKPENVRVEVGDLIDKMSGLFNYLELKKADVKDLHAALDLIGTSYEKISDSKKTTKRLGAVLKETVSLIKAKTISKDSSVSLLRDMSEISSEILTTITQFHPVASAKAKKLLLESDSGFSFVFYLTTAGSKAKLIAVKEKMVGDFRIIANVDIREVDLGKWAGPLNVEALRPKDLLVLAKRIKKLNSDLRVYFRTTGNNLKSMESLLPRLEEVSKNLDTLEVQDKNHREDNVRVIREAVSVCKTFITIHGNSAITVGNSANSHITRMSKIVRRMTKAHWKEHKGK